MDPRLENINDIRLHQLDDMERQMYKQKLLIEIAHFKQREQLYSQKRQELLELELRYRKNQGFQVKARSSAQDNGDVNEIVRQGLTDKVNEAKRKYDLAKSAWDDLKDKIGEAKETIQQRNDEFNEIKRVIEAKAEKGRQL